MDIQVCFKCMFQMLQLFQMYVASVLSNVALAIHICCKGMFQMFCLFRTYVAASSSCCKCFSSRRQKRAQVEAVPTCTREVRRAWAVRTEQRGCGRAGRPVGERAGATGGQVGKRAGATGGQAGEQRSRRPGAAGRSCGRPSASTTDPNNIVQSKKIFGSIG
jgi:hypothetical protein